MCVLVWGTEATGLPERIPSAWRPPIESGGPTALPRDSKNVEVAFDCTLTHTNSYVCICLVVLEMVLNIRAASANGTATAALPE